MAVTVEKIDNAIKEIGRFLAAAKGAKKKLHGDKYAKYAYHGCKETGAVRRASMDLSRALVEIRSTTD